MGDSSAHAAGREVEATELLTGEDEADQLEYLENTQQVFLLNATWWTAWRRFSGFGGRYGVTAAAPTFVTAPQRPGPIDNSALIVKAELDAEGGPVLRPGLREGRDFVALSAQSWQHLHRWYGGGPAILRSAVMNALAPRPGAWRLVLYPLRLEVWRAGVAKPKLLEMDETASVRELKQAACAAFRVADDASVVLWDFFHHSHYRLLEPFLEQSLGGARLLPMQPVLLELAGSHDGEDLLREDDEPDELLAGLGSNGTCGAGGRQRSPGGGRGSGAGAGRREAAEVAAASRVTTVGGSSVAADASVLRGGSAAGGDGDGGSRLSDAGSERERLLTGSSSSSSAHGSSGDDSSRDDSSNSGDGSGEDDSSIISDGSSRDDGSCDGRSSSDDPTEAVAGRARSSSPSTDDACTASIHGNSGGKVSAGSHLDLALQVAAAQGSALLMPLACIRSSAASSPRHARCGSADSLSGRPVLRFEVWFSQERQPRVATVDTMDTVAQLKRRACAVFGLRPEDVRLWDYHKWAKYKSLDESLEEAVSAVRLLDGQPLLLEPYAPPSAAAPGGGRVEG